MAVVDILIMTETSANIYHDINIKPPHGGWCAFFRTVLMDRSVYEHEKKFKPDRFSMTIYQTGLCI